MPAIGLKGMDAKEWQLGVRRWACCGISRTTSGLPDDPNAPGARNPALLQLKGKVIVFVQAGYYGKKPVFEHAKELGVRSVLIDDPSKEYAKWGLELKPERIVEEYISVSWDDQDVFDKCVAAIEEVKKRLGRLDGIVSFWDLSLLFTARLVKHFGLTGNTPEAVEKAQNKRHMREIMARSGLPCPCNFLIQSPNDIPLAANQVGFPAVIKPQSGAASVGVLLVRSIEDLKTKYTAGMEMVQLKYGADSHGRANENEKDEVPEKLTRDVFLMESYIDGHEVDVDMVINTAGEMTYIKVVDNWETKEPFFRETGSNSPSILPQDQQEALKDLAIKTVRDLGLTVGVFHGEAKFGKNGAQIIEVNPRMGGANVRELHWRVWNFDLVEEQLLASAGILSRPVVPEKPYDHIAEYLANTEESGYLENEDFLSEYSKHQDIVKIELLPGIKKGTHITGLKDGFPTRVYSVIAHKPTTEEAIDFIKKLVASIKVPLSPVPLP